MNALLLLEQGLNGLQFGLMLFLLAAGLTLVFGIMDMVNLAHGSLYMIGAYLAATLAQLQENEGQLLRVQQLLQQNLAGLAAAGSFEEAIHSLNAAVHLLTARASGTGWRSVG